MYKWITPLTTSTCSMLKLILTSCEIERGGNEMARAILYTGFIAVVTVSSYFFQMIVGLFFVSMLFTAADSPPGDVSQLTYVIFTVGLPIFWGIGLFMAYYIAKKILESFETNISVLFGIVISTLSTIYIILCLLPILSYKFNIPFSMFN